MRFIRWATIIPIGYTFIISAILTADLFMHGDIARATTFDGPTHIANMAQVFEGLQDGDFPVRWGAGWARYGWPAPLFAQQVSSYSGALLNFFVNNIVLSYHVTVLLSAFFSTYLFYIFLRNYVSYYSALLGATVFHFAPYRIINIYVRGALPEFMASIFIVSILHSLYLVLEKNRVSGLFLLTFSIGGLLLTHPFMMVVSSIFIVPYTIFLLLKQKKEIVKKCVLLVFFGGLGIGMAAYYLLPIFLEVKYLYYGGSSQHFTPGHFLGLNNFITEVWPYFTQNDIGPRGHVHQAGLIEMIIIATAFLWVGYRALKRQKVRQEMILLLGVASIYLVLMFPISEILYQNITLLGNVQHPWRMFTGFIFLPPLMIAFLSENTKLKQLIFFIVLMIIGILRFPQLYGKNYSVDLAAGREYFITDDNMHGTILNTIWMGEVRDYPPISQEVEKISIFEGEGVIRDMVIENAKRSFQVDARTNLKIVDRTFYFPGWRVYIDGEEREIQFQDPAYRGVITYEVPEGGHTVSERFTRTKPRILGDAVSVLSLMTFGILFVFKKQLTRFIS